MKIDELNTYESEQRGEALIFADIPNEAYHAGVGISSSAIRRFGESQLHAIEHVQETTPAMNLKSSLAFISPTIRQFILSSKAKSNL